MKLPKFCLAMLLSIFGLLAFTIATPAASAISYCSYYENYGCSTVNGSLGEFLYEMDERYDYYAESAFEYGTTTDGYGYTVFNTLHFQILVYDYVIEDMFTDEDYYDTSYFKIARWSEYDDDQNLMHDTIDYYAEALEDIYEWYEDDHDLDIWWNGGDDGRLPVIFGYDEDAAGYYDPYNGPYILINPYQDSKYHVRGTIAHELFHAIQNGYINADYIWYNNFAEGTAVTAQSKLYNWTDEDYLWLDEYSSLQTPEISVFSSNISGDYSSYGSFLWYTFLYEEYGKGIMKDLLESYADLTSQGYSPNFLAVLACEEVLEKEGISLAGAYLEYAVRNYDKQRYTDGDRLRDVDVLATHSSSVTDEYVGADDAPSWFGSNYIEFDVSNKEGELEVEFIGNNDAAFYLAFLSVDSGSVDYDNTISRYVDFGTSETIYVPNVEEYDDIVMVVSVISVDGSEYYTYEDFFQTYSYPYQYSAETNKLVYAISDSADLSDYDVEDFYPHEEGTTWEFMQISEYSGITETDSKDITAKKCSNNASNCFIYDKDGEETEYQFFGDSVQAHKYDGEDIDVTTVFSLDGSSGILDKEAYPLVDLDPEQFLHLNYYCTMSEPESYNYFGVSGEAVTENCITTLFDFAGHKYSLISESIYMPGIGNVYGESSLTFEGTELVKGYAYLTDTSLADVNFDEDLLASLEASENSAGIFSDLTSGHQNYSAILGLYGTGVINGYDDGTFKPNDGVNRAELLKILVEGLGITPDESTYANCFPDVTDDWYAKYVCYAKEEGWVEGYPDGYFRPADAVNKVEALKMLLNSQSVDTAAYEASATDAPFEDVATDAWYAAFVTAAKQLGILEEDGSTNYEPGNSMTRGGMCEALWRLISG